MKPDPNAPIKSLMTALPQTIGAEQTLERANEVMLELKVRHLPVLHGGELVGVLSDRDLGLIASLEGLELGTTTVEDAMTMEPYAVSPGTTVGEVIRTMAEHKYGSAIVVEGGKVLGIFTTHDAMLLLDRLMS